MTIKRTSLYVGIFLVLSSLALSGCSMSDGSDITTNQEIVEERPGVTMKGKLVQAAGKYFLQADGKDVEVTSRRIDLMPMVGKQVEVHGEFSGTTLYLDSIK